MEPCQHGNPYLECPVACSVCGCRCCEHLGHDSDDRQCDECPCDGFTDDDFGGFDG